ncbi:hypothetical protein [Sphingomonas sp. BK580]|uniref:hypothetical protein n=1 Tax=Sphingomonas sp. BK580 TaxID=2586972 RepID=UPI00160A1AB5|nr:hypothetical protein [Sphingomonas sp. BK580]MBB3695112.1 hypothetical protein [Sphingomonas sp. BK580]
MSDPKMPSRRALRVLALLAAFVALIWVVIFVGENVAHYRSLAKQQRAGEPGGVPRRPQP